MHKPLWFLAACGALSALGYGTWSLIVRLRTGQWLDWTTGDLVRWISRSEPGSFDRTTNEILRVNLGISLSFIAFFFAAAGLWLYSIKHQQKQRAQALASPGLTDEQLAEKSRKLAEQYEREGTPHL